MRLYAVLLSKTGLREKAEQVNTAGQIMTLLKSSKAGQQHRRDTYKKWLATWPCNYFNTALQDLVSL